MLAGMAAKWRWRAKRKAAGMPTDKPNMVCGPVQVVWHKFARYWDVEMREIPMAPGQVLHGRPSRCSSGSTRTPSWWCRPSGSPTPAPTSRCSSWPTALDELQEETGLDIDIHVDGASGAFLAPFVRPRGRSSTSASPGSSRSAPRVTSSAWPPWGSGWVIWRDKEELPEELIFHVTYLGGDMPDFQINFSRPAGQIIAQYYDFIRLGTERVRPDPPGVLRHRGLPGRGDPQARPLRAALREHPGDRDPGRDLADEGGGGSRLHPLRPGRPAPGPGVAGPGLPADRRRLRRGRPAGPGPPGARPRPGLACCWRTSRRPSSTSTGTRCRWP